MIQKTVLSIVLSCVLAMTSMVSSASDITGKVNAININKTWGGIFIQLVNLPKFEPGTACESSWAFMQISDEYAKHFISVALASKATGEVIRIGTKGCISTPPGQVPNIDWIDYGRRD